MSRRVSQVLLVPLLAASFSCNGNSNSIPSVRILSGLSPTHIVSPKGNSQSTATFDTTEFAFTSSSTVAIFDYPLMEIREYDLTGNLKRILAGGNSQIALPTFGCMAAANDGDVFFFSGNRIIKIDKLSSRADVIPWNEQQQFKPVSRIVVIGNGRFLLLSLPSQTGAWQVLKLDPLTGRTELFHEDTGRSLPAGRFSNSLNHWPVRPTEDRNGDIIIPDLLTYELSIYDANGQVKRVVNRDFEPQCMQESDLYLSVANYAFPMKEYLDLPKRLRCFPAVVGVRITDLGSKLVFTSMADKYMRFRVDVFDSQWNYVGSDYLYNFIRITPFQVIADQIAMPDLGFLEQIQERGIFSRLGAPKAAERILMYRLGI